MSVSTSIDDIGAGADILSTSAQRRNQEVLVRFEHTIFQLPGGGGPPPGTTKPW